MIVFRQSLLEQFRRVVSTEWADEVELLAAVRGQPLPPNWMMESGTEWHRLLASEVPGVVRYGRDHAAEPSRQFQFNGATVLAARRFVGPGLVEVPGSRVFDLGSQQVRVTGTCDHLRGLVVSDHKTCFSAPDARDYQLSLQWRVYLLIHHAQVFRYCLWHFAEPDSHGYCEFRDVVSFRFFAYPDMEQDVLRLVREFVLWAESRNVLDFLDNERQAAA
jgi:hypothetical protein